VLRDFAIESQRARGRAVSAIVALNVREPHDRRGGAFLDFLSARNQGRLAAGHEPDLPQLHPRLPRRLGIGRTIPRSPASRSTNDRVNGRASEGLEIWFNRIENLTVDGALFEKWRLRNRRD